MESQIRRYHCDRIWYDALARVARVRVLVLVKGECRLSSKCAEIGACNVNRACRYRYNLWKVENTKVQWSDRLIGRRAC
jgi:hypothetical protein